MYIMRILGPSSENTLHCLNENIFYYIIWTGLKKANYLLSNTFDEELQQKFKDCKIILSQKQPKSLLSCLSTAKFPSKCLDPIAREKITKCNDVRCKICPMYLQSQPSFTLSSGKVWHVKSNITCSSKNVIYYLKCNRCDGKDTYIGKTNNLRLRTNQHISTCRTGNGSNIFDQYSLDSETAAGGVLINRCSENLFKIT